MVTSGRAIHINILVLFLLIPGTELNAALAEIVPDSRHESECVPVGSWTVPGGGKISGTEVISNTIDQSVVLLGEAHANLEHHRWQLQMLASLHTRHPDMVIGLSGKSSCLDSPGIHLHLYTIVDGEKIPIHDFIPYLDGDQDSNTEHLCEIIESEEVEDSILEEELPIEEQEDCVDECCEAEE